VPTPPPNHVLKHHIYMSFKHLQGWRHNHFSEQSVPMLDSLFSEEFFPNIQSKFLVVQLQAVSSCAVTFTWEKRPTLSSLQPPDILVLSYNLKLTFSEKK